MPGRGQGLDGPRSCWRRSAGLSPYLDLESGRSTPACSAGEGSRFPMAGIARRRQSPSLGPKESSHGKIELTRDSFEGCRLRVLTSESLQAKGVLHVRIECCDDFELRRA